MKTIQFIIFLFFVYVASAQRVITLEQCDELFQKNNLFLLAEQYNIEVSKAAVIQAKIWEQPYLSGEFNLLNPQDNQLLNVGKTGQKGLAIQQLIYLGGKKKKEIDFAKSHVEIAELQYEDLLRTLRYQIHQNFYELYFNQVKMKSINNQVSTLDTLIVSYTIQVQKGNVSLKELVRLQSLSLFLKNQLLEIQQEAFVQQENLKILTNTSEDFIIQVNQEQIIEKVNDGMNKTLPQLQAMALEKNIEYLTSLKIIENSQLLLAWQKALAVPDLTVGAAYDQRGGAFQNQVNLTFGIPLPLWNKNKGNVAMAEAQINQQKMLTEQTKIQVSSKVSTTYHSFLYQKQQYNDTKSALINMEIVYNGIFNGFQKRNITLIEFTDFMESYNESVLFLNEIKKQLILNGETLNYLTNQKVF